MNKFKNLPKMKKAQETMRADVNASGSKKDVKDAEKTRPRKPLQTKIVEPEVEKKPQTKIYVYVQLKSIENVPQTEGPIEVELNYGGQTVQRLDCDCIREKDTDLRCENPAITFSFPIVQDSIDDLNMVSDHPIIISLFKRVVAESSVGMEEEENVYRKVYAQGLIDILGYFTKKRFSKIVHTYIYPTEKNDHIKFGTVKASWHIYALLPLLKNIDFSNLIFINFESLYNVTDDLMDDPEDIMTVLAFRSLLPNEHGHFETNKICSFSGFSRSIIKEQNPYLTWEAAKSNENYTGQNFGLQSENKVNVYKLFRRVLSPENVELNFNNINLEADEALTCNSMHRFVLTEELRALLEDVFVFRQQQLLVQLYRLGAPDDILLEGAIEPSVLLYPFVNAVRFAAVLTPPPRSYRATLDAGKTVRRKSKARENLGGGDGVPKPIFGIVSMCLLTPISESVESLANYTQGGRRQRLKFCGHTESEAIMAPYPLLIERAYDNFDEWIVDLVDFIVRNNVQEIDEARNFFCCQAENGSNKILKLVALDFNRRLPTKSNIEFCNLLTTVYKELTDRANNYIKGFGTKELNNFRKSETTSLEYLIKLMDFVKFSFEAGNIELGDMLFKTINKRYPKDLDLIFYIFLHNVELGNFTEAKKYFELKPRDRRTQHEYLIRILNIYIEYMENLSLELTYNEAYEKLLFNLREFLKYCQKYTDGWILLYCLYKKSGYLPGMEFARWHYEDLYNVRPHRVLENAPISRWSIYCNYVIQFRTIKAILFYESVKLFQSIGAYKFAEIIFNEIASECTDVERFIQTSTLKILLHELDPQAAPRNFPTANAGEIKAYVELVNGNIAYARGEEGTAIEYYKFLSDVVVDNDLPMGPFELGMRRHANKLKENKQWEEAVVAYKKCCHLGGSCMVSAIEMGRVLYKLGRYEEALECFKYSTGFKIHIPDVWAYLALINLKLGRNFNALECWKYAKLNPENVIADEIIEELNKINANDIDLYVDKPV